MRHQPSSRSTRDGCYYPNRKKKGHNSRCFTEQPKNDNRRRQQRRPKNHARHHHYFSVPSYLPTTRKFAPLTLLSLLCSVFVFPITVRSSIMDTRTKNATHGGEDVFALYTIPPFEIILASSVSFSPKTKITPSSSTIDLVTLKKDLGIITSQHLEWHFRMLLKEGTLNSLGVMEGTILHSVGLDVYATLLDDGDGHHRHLVERRRRGNTLIDVEDETVVVKVKAELEGSAAFAKVEVHESSSSSSREVMDNAVRSMVRTAFDDKGEGGMLARYKDLLRSYNNNNNGNVVLSNVTSVIVTTDIDKKKSSEEGGKYNNDPKGDNNNNDGNKTTSKGETALVFFFGLMICLLFAVTYFCIHKRYHRWKNNGESGSGEYYDDEDEYDHPAFYGTTVSEDNTGTESEDRTDDDTDDCYDTDLTVSNSGGDGGQEDHRTREATGSYRPKRINELSSRPTNPPSESDIIINSTPATTAQTNDDVIPVPARDQQFTGPPFERRYVEPTHPYEVMYGAAFVHTDHVFVEKELDHGGGAKKKKKNRNVVVNSMINLDEVETNNNNKNNEDREEEDNTFVYRDFPRHDGTPCLIYNNNDDDDVGQNNLDGDGVATAGQEGLQEEVEVTNNTFIHQTSSPTSHVTSTTTATTTTDTVNDDDVEVGLATTFHDVRTDNDDDLNNGDNDVIIPETNEFDDNNNNNTPFLDKLNRIMVSRTRQYNNKERTSKVDKEVSTFASQKTPSSSDGGDGDDDDDGGDRSSCCKDEKKGRRSVKKAVSIAVGSISEDSSCR